MASNSTSWRARRATTPDEVIAQAQDPRTRSLVTLAAAPAPDYGVQVDDRVGRGLVVSVTADMADPNTTPPTASNTVRTDQFGRVAFHVVFPTSGTGNLEVWVDGGLDASSPDPVAIGWLLVDVITGATSRREYIRDVGLRRSYIRLTGTANVDGGHPATVRATGVV